MKTPQIPAGALAPLFKFVKWSSRLRLFRCRTILWPTWAGFFCMAAILLILVAAWFMYGESHLARTHRSRADILVVEGWIGREGVRAAVDEFERGGYRYIVATGGLTSDFWQNEPGSFAEMAAHEMIRLGVSMERLVVAPPANTETHRTFESAVAVWRALRDAGIKPIALNVFTLGPHARRSALVFAKVNSHGPEIGVIGWLPSEYKTEAWWRSSDRSRKLIEETVAYAYELLFNSGRPSNSPVASTSPELQTHFDKKLYR